MIFTAFIFHSSKPKNTVKKAPKIPRNLKETLAQLVTKAGEKIASQTTKKDTSTAAKAMNKRIKEGSNKALLKQTQERKKAEKAAAKERTAGKVQQGAQPVARAPQKCTTEMATQRRGPKRKATSTGVSYIDDPDEVDRYDYHYWWCARVATQILYINSTGKTTEHETHGTSSPAHSPQKEGDNPQQSLDDEFATTSAEPPKKKRGRPRKI
jgi:hypothetical protein